MWRSGWHLQHSGDGVLREFHLKDAAENASSQEGFQLLICQLLLKRNLSHCFAFSLLLQISNLDDSHQHSLQYTDP